MMRFSRSWPLSWHRHRVAVLSFLGSDDRILKGSVRRNRMGWRGYEGALELEGNGRQQLARSGDGDLCMSFTLKRGSRQLRDSERLQLKFVIVYRMHRSLKRVTSRVGRRRSWWLLFN